MEDKKVQKKYQGELVSDEMRELISYRPHWIIRKGNTLFILVFIIILAATCLIRYRDTVKCAMRITAVNVPGVLRAKADGKLKKLLVKNEEEVTQGQPVAFLQRTALPVQVVDTIVAPGNGKVAFTSILEENQLVSQGQELLEVEPKENNYFGQLKVPGTGIGKLSVGQDVLVRLDGYPASEFGYLTGVIKYISPISSSRDSVLIKVDFPKGLQTNFNKKIAFRNNYLEQAEVMTEDRKLLDRLLDQVEALNLFK